jgi:hypothetical protein
MASDFKKTDGELQRTLGDALRESYRLPGDMPQQLLALLMQLDDAWDQRDTTAPTTAASTKVSPAVDAAGRVGARPPRVEPMRILRLKSARAVAT